MRTFAFSLLPYNESCFGTSANYGGSPLADEFVTLESGGDLVFDRLVVVVNPLGSQNLPDATEVHRLRPVAIEGDDVLNRPSQIGLALRSEQHSGGANILGDAGDRYAFGARTRY
jgi:hypothetical protein